MLIERVTFKDPGDISYFKRLVGENKKPGVSENVNRLLSKINLATTINEIPDIVAIDYNAIERIGIQPEDLADAIRLTLKLSCIRLNEREKNVKLTGFAHNPVSHQLYGKLKSSGFEGSLITTANNKFEDVQDALNDWRKDSSIWHVKTVQGAIIQKAEPVNFNLTFRQQQVAHLIKNRGLTNGQIAKEFGISEQAVKIHVSLILKKYGVKTRTQLILAMDNKW